MTMGILKVLGTEIVDAGNPVRLHGVNLGGWLMPEGYIMHAPNRAVRFFREKFIKEHGEKALNELETAFRDNFITQTDIARMKAFGFSCLRVPFHYGLVEKKPYHYDKAGLAYLDHVMRWAREAGMRVILDMHAVPGAQNYDWHSDSDGQVLFWKRKEYQRRAAELWGFLADRYKDEAALAGYDILNETVLDDPRPMNEYYHQAIKNIRSADKGSHIIFLEGNCWARDIACLDNFMDDNLALSIHFYEPIDFTFNFVPHLKYPLVSKTGRWDSAFMKKCLEAYKVEADRRRRPLLCGEFGVHSRNGLFGEDRWLADILSHFKTLDIHWTYWTWKAVKHYMFPDGVFSYLPNDPWVNRAGPDYGWETWHRYWKDNKRAMVAFWRTEAYKENRFVSSALKKFA
jgi:aryl-phospho-beta-D-glucosidase BglC (GH1 family)